MNGVLRVLRSGAHWQNPPERYGKWKTAHKRFSRWAAAGVWEKVFDDLIRDGDNQYLMLDLTVVRAPIPHDPLVYRLRNRIECWLNKLRHLRRFATCFDRLASHDLAFVHMAASMLWMR